MSYSLHNRKKRYVSMTVLHFFRWIIKENIIVKYNIRHVYSAIHRLWSNSHHLVKIFVIIYCLFFHTTLFIHPIFKSTRQILSMYIFLVSEYFRSRWDPTIQKYVNLEAHVFRFPNWYWEDFFKIKYCFKCELFFLTWVGMSSR